MSLEPTESLIESLVEFKAVIVLPTITRNYGNYPYGNYVGSAPVGKVIKHINWECTARGSVNIVKMTGNDR